MSNASPASQGTNANTSHGQAVLEAAKNRLNTAEQAMLSSQENFNKSTDRLLEQEKRLATIKAELKKLLSQEIQLSEIKRILTDAIALIVNMKREIFNLCRFFDNLANMVELVVKNHVDAYIMNLKNMTSDNPDSEA